jgi:hypothetical protein
MLERLATEMQEPFIELTELCLSSVSNNASATVLPDSFLGGSAPHLTLTRIPFPAIPKLLLTSNNLISVRLFEIPNTGYFSSEGWLYAYPH